RADYFCAHVTGPWYITPRLGAPRSGEVPGPVICAPFWRSDIGVFWSCHPFPSASISCGCGLVDGLGVPLWDKPTTARYVSGLGWAWYIMLCFFGLVSVLGLGLGLVFSGFSRAFSPFFFFFF
ncbi:hypothetical protein BDV38DRAFT_245298, partial [Aspergillus pseudotamarii]